MKKVFWLISAILVLVVSLTGEEIVDACGYKGHVHKIKYKKGLMEAIMAHSRIYTSNPNMTEKQIFCLNGVASITGMSELDSVWIPGEVPASRTLSLKVRVRALGSMLLTDRRADDLPLAWLDLRIGSSWRYLYFQPAVELRQNRGITDYYNNQMLLRTGLVVGYQPYDEFSINLRPTLAKPFGETADEYDWEFGIGMDADYQYEVWRFSSENNITFNGSETIEAYCDAGWSDRFSRDFSFEIGPWIMYRSARINSGGTFHRTSYGVKPQVTFRNVVTWSIWIGAVDNYGLLRSRLSFNLSGKEE